MFGALLPVITRLGALLNDSGLSPTWSLAALLAPFSIDEYEVELNEVYEKGTESPTKIIATPVSHFETETELANAETTTTRITVKIELYTYGEQLLYLTARRDVVVWHMDRFLRVGAETMHLS
ncbi:hypothetical protein TNIN_296571 [Trichonephila inaurata madagascariensis]|uniref:Uncharacterized protein n=1 Tax=Trichonephila inaurata madagascariensis TaxID=2747483 RepID=A0A8X6WS27_9ARAC|nr:hypothetical protein TNIN_296571 [Trichonephila inaurata madagascariensis]